RRRAIQMDYNKEHDIDPAPLVKRIADITERLQREDEDTRELLTEFDYGKGKRGYNSTLSDEQREAANKAGSLRPRAPALTARIDSVFSQLHSAVADLQFELGARLRDELSDLKRELRQMKEAGHAWAHPRQRPPTVDEPRSRAGMFILVCWRKGVSRPSVIVTTTPAGVRARSARGHCEWLQRGRDFRHGDISFTTKGTHGYPVLHPGRRRPCGERIADPTVVHDQFEHRGGRDPP